jgi:hypothetical protein
LRGFFNSTKFSVITKVAALEIGQADAATLVSWTFNLANVVAFKIAIGQPFDATVIASPMVSP